VCRKKKGGGGGGGETYEHPKHMPDETKKTFVGLYKDGSGFNIPSSHVAQWDCYGDNDCAEHTVRLTAVATVSMEWLTLICNTRTSESWFTCWIFVFGGTKIPCNDMFTLGTVQKVACHKKLLRLVFIITLSFFKWSPALAGKRAFEDA